MKYGSKNTDIIFSNIEVHGVLHPQLHIVGKKTKSTTDKIIAFVDGKEMDLINNSLLNRDYVFRKILNHKYYNFSYYCNCDFKSRKLEVFLQTGKNKEPIYSKNINIFNRIIDKIFNTLKSIFHKLVKLPKLIGKVIKIAWTRHHFLISPKMLKQYLRSFKNNINRPTNFDNYYLPDKHKDYLKWLSEKEKLNSNDKFNYNPLISIIIPVYNVKKEYLIPCIDSVLNQTYSNFEICIADDCSTNKETIETLREYEKKDKRIKVVYRKENGHISDASNSALAIATGTYIGLLDNDDILSQDALFEVVKVLNKDKTIDMIYSDEDKIDLNGKRRDPHFKPDFSPDTLMSINYICHFTVLRKSIVEKLGGFRKEYNGSQDYDLFLRFTEKTKNIYHIPKILYHWRMIPGSTSVKMTNKDYAYLNGKKALEDALKRRNTKGIVHLEEETKSYFVEYTFDVEPKVSIIICTKDKADLLNKCLQSIYEKTTYKNYEIIVIDNNSQEQNTFDLLEKYKKEHSNFAYYRYKCEFNYAYLNNEGVKKSKGEYVILLNNDIEVVSSNWLKYMIGYAMQDHIGCVGAKLLYPNNTVQHCGVVVGVCGIGVHAFIGTGQYQPGYFGRLKFVYNWSAVTGACLAISKNKFNEVSGLDENLKVAFNDIDLNMKLLDNYYNVVIPNAILYHHESASRGNDMVPEKIKRFESECSFMVNKWEEKICSDKFYNSNFSYYYPFVLEKEHINEK